MHNQKNIITRDSIKQSLLRSCKTHIRVSLVVLTALGLAAILIFAIALAVSSVFRGFWQKLIILLLMGIPMFIPVLVFLAQLVEHLRARRRLLKDDFEIVTAVLLYKKEETYRPLYHNRRYKHKKYLEILYFDGFFTPTDHTTYQLATAGDTFYLVRLKGDNYFLATYPEKTYKYMDHQAE